MLPSPPRAAGPTSNLAMPSRPPSRLRTPPWPPPWPPSAPSPPSPGASRGRSPCAWPCTPAPLRKGRTITRRPPAQPRRAAAERRAWREDSADRGGFGCPRARRPAAADRSPSRTAGAWRFKDPIVPEHVWQVTGAGLPGRLPATAHARRPAQQTCRPSCNVLHPGLARCSWPRSTAVGAGATCGSSPSPAPAAPAKPASPCSPSYPCHSSPSPTGCWLCPAAALAQLGPRARNHSRHLRAAVGRRPDLSSSTWK